MMKSARTSIKNPARKPRPKPAPSPPPESRAVADPTDSLADLFCRFTTSILTRLQQSPLAENAHWRGCDHFQPGASITFLELRKSAKAAGWVPSAVSIAEPHQDEDIWPDIGIRKHLPAAQWLHRHVGGPSL